MTKDEFFTNWNTSKTWMIAINNKPIDKDGNKYVVMIGFSPNKVVTGSIELDFDDEDDDEYPF